MTENWNIQVSPKLPDGTLINIRGRDEGEFITALETVTRNAQKIVETIALLNGTKVVVDSGATGVQQDDEPVWAHRQPAAAPAAPAAPAPTTAPGSGASPACHHGPKVYREAKPGSGKSWKGWFCPSPKGTPDQCSPEFVKDR